MEPENTNYEQKLQEVQNIISLIENGSIPLEKAVEKYEEGIAMLDSLEKQLNEMKRRITVVRKDQQGQISEEPSEMQ